MGGLLQLNYFHLIWGDSNFCEASKWFRSLFPTADQLALSNGFPINGHHLLVGFVFSRNPTIIPNRWTFHIGHFFTKKTNNTMSIFLWWGWKSSHGLIGASGFFGKCLLRGKNKPCTTGKDGRRNDSKSADGNHRQVVHFLIDAKADLELTTTEGNTPLHHAAEENFSAACGYLFRKPFVLGMDGVVWGSCVSASWVILCVLFVDGKIMLFFSQLL